MIDVRAERIVALWSTGRYAQVEIADELGISQGTVSNTLKARGLRGSRRRSRGGRPKVWPDCPPRLRDDYQTLRRAGYPAAEARAMLEKYA